MAKKAFLSDKQRKGLRRHLQRAGGLTLIMVAGVFCVALGTYHPDDPGMFSATLAIPQNKLGLSGAYGADMAIRFLGYTAWLLPILLLVWGYKLLRYAPVGKRFWLMPLIAVLLLPVAAGFISLHKPGDSWVFDMGLGGIIGDEILRGALLLTGGLTTPPFPILRALIVLLPAMLVLMWFACGVRWSRAQASIRLLRYGAQDIAAAVGSFGVHVLGKARESSFLRSKDDRETPIMSRDTPLIQRGTDVGEHRQAPMDATPLIERPGEATSPAPPPKSRRKSSSVPSYTGDFSLPPMILLQEAPKKRSSTGRLTAQLLKEQARILESVLQDYGVRGEIIDVRPGPVVTLYELEPAPGLKASRVISLADDIARSMSALSARVSTVPGRNVIGIELPNDDRETVYLSQLLKHESYIDESSLALALGKDIAGEPVIANLAKMPHLLIAGTTGSGKSVAINTMILSLLYKHTPKQCRMIMIDPKMLELSVYDDIPHLLSPVVTDPKKAVVALKWVVREMEERYRKMSKLNVRNIAGYNEKVLASLKNGEELKRVVQTGYDEATGQPIYEEETFLPEELPLIVVIVDEMADLMMVAGKEIEACIQRLAQMARASGIHLIMATQRPSVDVITGTIKANFPTRISFQVTSKIDSRTILGEQGAEQLLGMGDMLYMSGGGRVVRVHGPFVSDSEVEDVVQFLKSLGEPDYIDDVTSDDGGSASDVDEILGLGGGNNDNALYDQAVAIVARERKASTSFIQRKLQIGYNRAARIVDDMEAQGVVSSANHVGKREVLIAER